MKCSRRFGSNMAYRVNASGPAKKDVKAAYEWIAEDYPDLAEEWYKGLIAAVNSLDEMPRRCPAAREQRKYKRELRQLLYGKGKSAYRILFTIQPGEEDGEDGVVRIVRIWHTARKDPTRNELNEGDED